MIYVLIILTLIFIMPIKVVITKNDKESNIDILFTKLFDVRLDLDELIRFIFTTKEDRAHITFDSIVYNIGILKRSKNIFTSLTKMSRINKLSMIIKTKSNSLEADTYGFVFSWIALGYLQDFIHQNFRKVDNEYYNHQISDVYNINLECHINFRMVYLIFAIIRNVKDIPKIRKFIKKGSKIYGSSNI